MNDTLNHKEMKFYNHANTSLYNEAIKIISNETWANSYKRQTLNNVVDELEKGIMLTTETGGYTVPFRVSDVKSIVDIVSQDW